MNPISVAGVTAGVIAVASGVLFGVAMGFDPAAGAELVERIADASPEDAEFIRWGAMADLLGYYLIPAGVIVATRNRVPWTSDAARDIAVGAAVMYATIGAIGAGALAAAAPPLIEGGAEARLSLVTLATVVEGLWQWVEPLPFTVWAAGTALAFRPRGSRWAGAFGLLAVAGAVVWLGRILGVEPVLVVGLVLWLGPFPLVMAGVGSWPRNDFGTVGG